MLMAARDKASGAPMGERELVDEVMTLIIAGHETAASGLNAVWYLLSQHPEAEAKLHREIDALAQTQAPSLKLSESLLFTRRVINEALRLYPPVWMMSRQSIGPDRLAGYEIPAGVELLLSPYLVHRHPKFWSDPELFQPERPEPVSDAGGPLFARIPFGAGARHCIGESLALYEMSLHVYRVGRRFRLTILPHRRWSWRRRSICAANTRFTCSWSAGDHDRAGNQWQQAQPGGGSGYAAALGAARCLRA